MANDVTSKVILGLDPSDFRRSIQQVDARLKETAKQFNNLGGVIGAAFAGGAILNFAQDAMRLGDELQKVSQGFARFGNEANLEQLRQSTRGLVSDLELMKQATKAGTFGIGIGEMGSLLQFATRRAQETGQEVDYLVNSIVTGIGRKSPLILDNLGISASQLRAKLNGVSVEAASIGEISAAVGQIAQEQLVLMGDAAVTATDRMQQLSVRWENLKANVGTGLQEATLSFIDTFDKFFTYMKGGLFGMRDLVLEMNGIITDQSVLRMAEMANALKPATGIGATEPTRPGGAPVFAFGAQPEQTLANMRETLKGLNAELENVQIGSQRFNELRKQIEALDAQIKKLTTPLKEVFVVPTAEAIKLADKGLAYINNELTYQDRILRSGLIPAYDEMALMIKGAKRQLEDHAQTMEAAALVGAQFGHILTSAFTASMNTGEDFFQSMRRAIIEYTKQIAVALAVTTALAAIFSAVTGKSFVTAFKGVAKGTGLGAFFGEGGLFEMNATVKGADLKLGTDRSTVNLGRSGG